MNRAIATVRLAGLGLTCVLLWSAGTAFAVAEADAPPETPASLNAIDFNFVGQAKTWARPSRSTPDGSRKQRAPRRRSAATLT
jgi:hypothetical protein